MGCTCHSAGVKQSEPCGGAAAQSTELVPGFGAGLLAAPSWAKGSPTGCVCKDLGNSHQGV